MNEQNTNTQSEILGMKLNVSVYPIEPKKNLLAFASMKINDCFVVDGIKVLTGEKGLFVNMPSTKDNNGEYHDICFPVTSDFRKQITKAVLDGYTAALDKTQEKKPSVHKRIDEAKKETQNYSSSKEKGSQKRDGNER